MGSISFGVWRSFVLLNHVNMRLVIAQVPYTKGLPHQLVSSLLWNGQYGVQMFFAVSGFLITSTTFRRWSSLSKVSVRDFYLLRFARIAPRRRDWHFCLTAGYSSPTALSARSRRRIPAEHLLEKHSELDASIRGGFPYIEPLSLQGQIARTRSANMIRRCEKAYCDRSMPSQLHWQ